MKKKYLIIIIVIIALISVGAFLLFKSKDAVYTVKVSIVDDRSPDRALVVLNDKGEQVEVTEIQLLDGRTLCSGYNLTVYYGELEGVNEVKVILKDKTEVRAKIVKEEVKK